MKTYTAQLQAIVAEIEDAHRASQERAAQQPDDDNGKGGWVEYEANEFKHGEKVSSVRGRITQKQFEILLQTGETEPGVYKRENCEQVDLFDPI